MAKSKPAELSAPPYPPHTHVHTHRLKKEPTLFLTIKVDHVVNTLANSQPFIVFHS